MALAFCTASPINQWLPSRTLSESFRAIIRAALEVNSSDSSKFSGGKDLFYSVSGLGKGVWGIRDYDSADINNVEINLTSDDVSFFEGKQMLKVHLKRERNSSLVRQAKERFMHIHGKLFCEACSFDFEKVYKELGVGFIEAHHILPLSSSNERVATKIEDLVMVCSNCHSMLHRMRPWLSRDELNRLVPNENQFL